MSEPTVVHRFVVRDWDLVDAAGPDDVTWSWDCPVCDCAVSATAAPGDMPACPGCGRLVIREGHQLTYHGMHVSDDCVFTVCTASEVDDDA